MRPRALPMEAKGLLIATAARDIFDICCCVDTKFRESFRPTLGIMPLSIKFSFLLFIQLHS